MIVVPEPPLLLASAPVTGGRWLGKVLRKLPGAKSLATPCAPAWLIYEDESLAELRAPQLLRVGLVRDPWSWYAEAWMTGMRAGGPALASVRAWGGGSTRFRDFLWGATHPEKVTEVPDPLGVLWAPLTGGGHQALIASTLGLCSFTFLYHYGTKVAWSAPTERPGFAVDVLADGNSLPALAAALAGADATLPPVPPAAIPLTMRDGYDAEMTRWVAEADRPLLTAMRYGPFTPAGVGLMFPVRKRGEARKEPVVPLPVATVERMDRSTVESTRAALKRRPAGTPTPTLPATLARLRKWIEQPG